MKRYVTAAVLSAALFVTTGCHASLASSQSDFYAMDTFMTVTAYHTDKETAHTAQTKIEQRVNALDGTAVTSAYRECASELNRANGAPVTVDRELYEVIETAVDYAELTIVRMIQPLHRFRNFGRLEQRRHMCRRRQN